ncbi:hypothetical protein GCM10010517_43870 [Streptosporangium fragile]|uniref:Uncharacterized protein n=1 Tax=Streptosporangium fragile TaxID=46186 RepID=A0ABP6IGH3_9ACTN
MSKALFNAYWRDGAPDGGMRSLNGSPAVSGTARRALPEPTGPLAPGARLPYAGRRVSPYPGREPLPVDGSGSCGEAPGPPRRRPSPDGSGRLPAGWTSWRQWQGVGFFRGLLA